MEVSGSSHIANTGPVKAASSEVRCQSKFACSPGIQADVASKVVPLNTGASEMPPRVFDFPHAVWVVLVKFICVHIVSNGGNLVPNCGELRPGVVGGNQIEEFQPCSHHSRDCLNDSPLTVAWSAQLWASCRAFSAWICLPPGDWTASYNNKEPTWPRRLANTMRGRSIPTLLAQIVINWMSLLAFLWVLGLAYLVIKANP